MVCVSVTFFVRNVTDISKSICMVNETGNIALDTGKAVDVVFSDGSVHVKKCYLYGRKERLAICGYIQRELLDRGFHERSAQSLLAELTLRAVCYRLGIR